MYTYDAMERVTEASNSVASVESTFDERGRLTAQNTTLTGASPTTVEYEYDKASRLLSRVQPANTTAGTSQVLYTYDAARRNDEVEIDGDTISATLDALGRPVESTFENGMVVSTAFDAAGALDTLGYEIPDGSSGLELLAQWQYTRDDALRPTSVGRTLAGSSPPPWPQETVSFEYDTWSRLAKECVGAVASTCSAASTVNTFAYDNVGNRTGSSDAGGSTTTTFNTVDAPTSTVTPGGTVTRTFDDAGRLSSWSDGTDSFSYTWDAASRLASLSDGTDMFEYGYDPLGGRVTVDDGTDTVKYMWDHSSSAALPGLLSRDDVGFVSVGGSTPLAADVPDGQSGTDRLWLVTGPYGTPVTATYGTGHADTGVAVQAPVSPSVYGQGAPGVAGLGFLGLPGQADDMSMLRARVYDAGLGVFTSPDQLNDPTAGVFDLGSPAVSAYLYGYGNPALFTDPSGLYPGSSGMASWAGSFKMSGPTSSFDCHNDETCAIATTNIIPGQYTAPKLTPNRRKQPKPYIDEGNPGCLTAGLPFSMRAKERGWFLAVLAVGKYLETSTPAGLAIGGLVSAVCKYTGPGDTGVFSGGTGTQDHMTPQGTPNGR